MPGKKRKHVDYNKYLNSHHWRNKKAKYRRNLGENFKCSKCGTAEHIHLHHTNYDRLYREKKEDIVLLCEYCHRVVHQLVYENQENLLTAHLSNKIPRKHIEILFEEFGDVDREYREFIKNMR